MRLGGVWKDRGLRAVRTAVTALALLTAAGLGTALAWGPGTAAGSSSPSPSPSRTPLTARFGTTFDADNLNPFIGRSGTAYEILHLNYDFLVGYDTDLSPRPELATSWAVSPDGRTWTFQLRRGVTWHDGRRFTSRDVAFTYNLIIENELTAFTSYTKDIVEVVPEGDYAVRMVCSQPKANMLRLRIPILPEHIWAKVPAETLATSTVNEPPIVGTGPFQTVDVEKGNYVKLVKNPHYWVEGKPTIDELVIAVYQNPDTMAQDLKSGALDYALGIPPAQFGALRAEPALTASAADLRYFDEIAMNCYDSPDSLGHPALRDPAFRRALSWAVDRQRIVDLAYGGYAVVGHGMIAPDVPWYYWEPGPAIAFGFDIKKAGRLLDEAGYPLKDGARVDEKGEPIVLRLWTRTDDPASQLTGRLVAGWFAEIGLQIELQNLDPNAISDALYHSEGDTYAPDYDLYVGGWGQHVDPDNILNVFTTPQIGGWNDACWSNADFDKLYERQARTIDPAKRKPLVDRMAEIFYTEAPFIITNYEQQLEAYDSEEWQGWTQAPRGTGPVAFVNDNVDTYLNLRPKAVAKAAPDDGGETLIYVGVAVAVLAGAIVAVLLLRRGRGRALEE